MSGEFEWYKQWFDSNYLTVYQHRDDSTARREVEALTSLMNLTLQKPILDIACGAGRHVRALEDLAYPVQGGDLSFELLREGKRLRPRSSYVQHDMRELPYQAASFASILSLFTSFGYFAEEVDHIKTLREIRRVLISNGLFILDYLNPPFVLSRLQATSEKDIPGGTILEKRSYDASHKRLTKNISLQRGEKNWEYVESVRVFEYAELRELLGSSGFTEVSSFGDFDGSSLSPHSPRQIIIARSMPS